MSAPDVGKEVVQLVVSSYMADPCGICEKPSREDDVFWFSRVSRTAHKSCYDRLKQVEQEADRLLDSCCTQYNRADAHIAVVQQVRNKVGVPLLDIIELPGGEECLRKHFTEAAQGVVAWRREKDRLKQREKEFMDALLQRVREDMKKKEAEAQLKT